MTLRMKQTRAAYQQQSSGVDCCLFSKAFAYHAARGGDVSKLKLDQEKLREKMSAYFKFNYPEAALVASGNTYISGRKVGRPHGRPGRPQPNRKESSVEGPYCVLHAVDRKPPSWHGWQPCPRRAKTNRSAPAVVAPMGLSWPCKAAIVYIYRDNYNV